MCSVSQEGVASFMTAGELRGLLARKISWMERTFCFDQFSGFFFLRVKALARKGTAYCSLHYSVSQERVSTLQQRNELAGHFARKNSWKERAFCINQLLASLFLMVERSKHSLKGLFSSKRRVVNVYERQWLQQRLVEKRGTMIAF